MHVVLTYLGLQLQIVLQITAVPSHPNPTTLTIELFSRLVRTSFVILQWQLLRTHLY